MYAIGSNSTNANANLPLAWPAQRTLGSFRQTRPSACVSRTPGPPPFSSMNLDQTSDACERRQRASQFATTFFLAAAQLKSAVFACRSFVA